MPEEEEEVLLWWVRIMSAVTTGFKYLSLSQRMSCKVDLEPLLAFANASHKPTAPPLSVTVTRCSEYSPPLSSPHSRGAKRKIGMSLLLLSAVVYQSERESLGNAIEPCGFAFKPVVPCYQVRKDMIVFRSTDRATRANIVCCE